MNNIKIKLLLIFSLVFFCISLGYSQGTIFQEEQDWRFARQLADKGMWDLSALQFFKYAENYPTSPNAPEALFRSAESYDKVNRQNDALEGYLRLLLKYPQSTFVSQAQFNRALILLRLGNFLEAGLAFERVRLFMPKSELVPQAQLNASKAFLQANEAQRALDADYLLLEEFPTHPLRFEARYVLALIRGRQKQPNLALQELNRIVGERLEDNLSVNALMLKAELLQSIGRYSIADSVLRAIVGSGAKSDSVGSAALKLASSLQERGDYHASQEIIDQALPLPAATLYQPRLKIIQGDNHYALEDYQAAAKCYDAIQPAALSAREKTELEYRKGAVQQKLGKSQEALDHFDQVLAAPDTIPGAHFLQKQALFEAANILSASDRPAEALRLLRARLEQAKTQTWSDELLYVIGKTQGEFLKDGIGARQAYSTLLELYPQSKLADDALLALAKSYDSEEKYAQALEEYRRFIGLFPGSEAYPVVKQRMDLLHKFSFVSSESADKAFNGILLQSLSGTDKTQVLADWTEQQIFTFHDYERGLAIVRLVLSAQGIENIDQSKLYYLAGYAHALLAEEKALAHQSHQAQAHGDSLLSIAALMEQIYPTSAWTNQLKGLAVDAALKYLPGANERIVLLDSTLSFCIRNNAADSLKNSLQFRLARELYLTSQDKVDMPGLIRAEQLCHDLIVNSGSGAINGDCHFLQAEVFLRMARPDTAAVLLEKFLNTFSSAPQIVEASYQLAAIYEKKGRIEKAKEIYWDISQRFYYTMWADRSLLSYCRLLIAQGQTEKAITCLQQKLGSPALTTLAIFFSDSGEDEFLWLWAQAKASSLNPLDGRAALKDYLALSKEGIHRAEALLTLGELSYRMQDMDAALGYWEELEAVFPQDSLALQARVKTADIYFDRQNYPHALKLYASIKSSTRGDLLRHVSAREALCELKTGNLAKATKLMEAFKKEFDDRSSEGLFLYEKGNLFISEKNFKEAEAAFKDLSSRYKDIPEGAQGDLGLGRLYVILNRTEDALKLLTNIPSRYKDAGVVAAAYVNLADFYYQNRQLDNCVFACRKVMEVQPKGTEHASALRLLIRAYDDYRLWDQAIALAREYVDSYPDAQDVTSKRSQIGVFLYDLKEYDRAIAYFRDLKPLVDADTETELQYWIAKSYADRGSTEEAITEFLKVKYLCKETKLPWGATALYEAAQSYRKLGQLKKARDLFYEIVRDRGSADQIGRVANERIKEIDDEMAKAS